jgi:hypothetical protein
MSDSTPYFPEYLIGLKIAADAQQRQGLYCANILTLVQQ